MTEADFALLRQVAATTVVDLADLTVDEARARAQALASGVLVLLCERDVRIAHLAPPAFAPLTEADIWPGPARPRRPPPKERKKYVRNPRGSYDRNLPVKRIAK